MKINVASRKLIKPYKPTPKNLNKLNLSFLDELSPATNIGIILLYPKNPSLIISTSPQQKLQVSLSKTLTQFYPLAGRYIKKDHYVDCSDQGAEWVEAEAVETELTDVMAQSEADRLKDLLPRQTHQVDLESSTDPLLSIQITVFKRGGLAIGISIWHRICDASSLGTFVKAWSNTAAVGPTESTIIRPSFDLEALFPRNLRYLDDLWKRAVAAGIDHRPSNNIVAKRFRFNKEAIASVRSRYDLIRADVHYSRVRVVCAVITRALIGVDQKKHGGEPRACMAAQAVNMRGRTVPPAPDHSCGNLVTMSLTRHITATETENIISDNVIGVHQLVDLLGDGLQRTISECADMLSPDKDRYVMATTPTVNLLTGFVTGGVNIVMFTDWSKLGLYEADFGWGKPVGTGIGAGTRGAIQENYMVLMESKDGDGVEVWVHLTPSDMTCFEQDQEIQKLLNT